MNKSFGFLMTAVFAIGAASVDANAERGRNRRCEERDFGALRVGKKSTRQKHMRCDRNEYRRDQHYTGTSVLECDWDLRYASATLECSNPRDKMQDADHVYMTCCRE